MNECPPPLETYHESARLYSSVFSLLEKPVNVSQCPVGLNLLQNKKLIG